MTESPSFDVNEAIKEIATLSASDKAMCASLGFKLKRDAPELVEYLIRLDDARKAALPFPKKDDITALEVAIFDNWKPFGGVRPAKGKKGHNLKRFKAVLKVWTCPVSEVNFSSRRGFQKFEVLLQGASDLEPKATKMAKHHPAMSEALLALLASEAMEGRIAGPLTSKPHGEGTVTHGAQIFMLDEDITAPVAIFVDAQTSEMFELAPFSNRDASGRALLGNVILQSRFSPDPVLANWVTKAKISINTK